MEKFYFISVPDRWSRQPYDDPLLDEDRMI